MDSGNIGGTLYRTKTNKTQKHDTAKIPKTKDELPRPRKPN